MSRTQPRKTFLVEDQTRFALLSGDSNPMHMDALAARRTPAGQPAVHGVHILLWALDCLAAANPARPLPDAIRANFMTFLLVGKTLELGEPAGQSAQRVTATADGLPIMTLELRRGAPSTGGFRVAEDSGGLPLSPDTPVVLDFDDIKEGQKGALAFAAGDEAAKAAFPHACNWLGSARVNGLLCCTRLVGMVCPGLHSIFNRIDVALVDAANGPPHLRYSVEKVDLRFRQVKLAVTGGGVTGSLVTSVRHPPVQQLSILSLAPMMTDPQAYRGSTALVVGGSRGLGELTAKLLALGGAEVIISYARGRSDAEKVALEINGWGGNCRALRYDVCEDPLQQLEADAARITHCYYYATPPIFVPTANIFDPARFDVFYKFYIQAFSELCDALCRASTGRVGVFYPSSIAVAERAAGMLEYTMVKAAGEIFCDEYNQRQKTLRILSNRLPRLSTDQTATLASTEAGPGVEILRPLIEAVQAIGLAAEDRRVDTR